MTEATNAGAGDWRGLRLGRWTLLGPLGSGGLGAVYEATDDQGRRAALKAFDIADDRDGEMAQAFERESRSMRLLAHPDIVIVLDSGEARGLVYLVMELVDGHDLSRHVHPDAALPDRVVFGLGERVARALAHAHGQGVVHRDIKPANILVNWSRDVVKLCDFGVARLGDAFRSRTGVMFGTPAYMSPEQLADAPVDGRTDLYALGVVLYELLARRLPHVSGSLGELLRRVAHEEPTPLVRLRPDLPHEAAAFVHRLLAKQPGLRPQDANVVAAEAARLRLQLAPPPAGWPDGPKSRG